MMFRLMVAEIENEDEYGDGGDQVTPTKTICDDCQHRPHEAGKCKRCNCGQSKISHAQTPYKPHYPPIGLKTGLQSGTQPTFDCGRTVPRRKVEY